MRGFIYIKIYQNTCGDIVNKLGTIFSYRLGIYIIVVLK